MAMIWAGFTPAFRQASRELSMGSTRAKTRWEKFSIWENAGKSLLPVVSRMRPSVVFKKATAEAMSATYTAPSGTLDAPRSRRRYSVWVSWQAPEMLSVMDVA